MKKEIPEQITKEQLELYNKYIERVKINYKTKKNCKHCHERGVVGFKNGIPIICSCVKKIEPKVISINGKSYTESEYKKYQEQQKEKKNADSSNV